MIPQFLILSPGLATWYRDGGAGLRLADPLADYLLTQRENVHDGRDPPRVRARAWLPHGSPRPSAPRQKTAENRDLQSIGHAPLQAVATARAPAAAGRRCQLPSRPQRPGPHGPTRALLWPPWHRPTRTRPLGHTRRTCARHGDPPRPPPNKLLRLGRIARGMFPYRADCCPRARARA